MTNLYVFWKESDDPPSPWTRLTRTNQYIRFDSDVGTHWDDTGSSTHTHATVSSWTCNNGTSGVGQAYSSGSAMAPHSHDAPSSYTISSNNNNPPCYGLDIIYMDLDIWEQSYCSFPDGVIVLSSGTLVDAELTRFSDADGKYILHATPSSTSGTTTPQTHTVTGTTGSSGTSTVTQMYTGSVFPAAAAHTHTINIVSASKYVEPANLVTRLYEITVNTSKALSGIVVLVDGTPGANWSVLSAWSDSNLKSGDSNPTLSGSDTHTQTFSGSTSAAALTGVKNSSDDGPTMSTKTHSHTVSGTLDAISHVPYSKKVIAAELLNTLSIGSAVMPQLVGLSSW